MTMALPERRRDHKQRQSAGSKLDWHAFYDIENPADVDVYVAEHPSAIPILTEAPGEIRAVFGDTGAPLALQLIREPEDGEPYLYLLVQTAQADAYDLLDQLDAAWWLDAARDTRAELEIAIQRP